MNTFYFGCSKCDGKIELKEGKELWEQVPDPERIGYLLKRRIKTIARCEKCDFFDDDYFKN